MGFSFSLSLTAVDILLEHQNLGSAPSPFATMRQVGASDEERARVRDAVFRELAGRRIFDRGRLDADTELSLRTFVHGPIAIVAVAQLDRGGQLFARVASDGQNAVVARQEQNLLIFDQVRPEGIVPSIVDLLPRVPAAGGQSVTIAKPAPERPQHAPDDDYYESFARAAPSPRSAGSAQVRMAERIFRQPKLRLGQFTAYTRGAAMSPTIWFDTPEGRYFGTSRTADDGQSWLTYAPADNARIVRHLDSQLRGGS